MRERVDVSKGCELKNGKSNAFGSDYEIWHDGKRIGWIESCYSMAPTDGYAFEEVPEGVDRRLIVWKAA